MNKIWSLHIYCILNDIGIRVYVHTFSMDVFPYIPTSIMTYVSTHLYSEQYWFLKNILNNTELSSDIQTTTNLF
jgi:hypothetical protein